MSCTSESGTASIAVRLSYLPLLLRAPELFAEMRMRLLRHFFHEYPRNCGYDAQPTRINPHRHSCSS
jgi:hypothetical protein